MIVFVYSYLRIVSNAPHGSFDSPEDGLIMMSLPLLVILDLLGLRVGWSAYDGNLSNLYILFIVSSILHTAILYIIGNNLGKVLIKMKEPGNGFRSAIVIIGFIALVTFFIMY